MHRKHLYIKTDIVEKINSPLQLTRKHFKRTDTKSNNNVQMHNNIQMHNKHLYNCDELSNKTLIDFKKTKIKRTRNVLQKKTNNRLPSLPKIN